MGNHHYFSCLGAHRDPPPISLLEATTDFSVTIMLLINTTLASKRLQLGQHKTNTENTGPTEGLNAYEQVDLYHIKVLLKT